MSPLVTLIIQTQNLPSIKVTRHFVPSNYYLLEKNKLIYKRSGVNKKDITTSNNNFF
jgi:hypothetical protein